MGHVSDFVLVASMAVSMAVQKAVRLAVGWVDLIDSRRESEEA